ncbi:MAG: ribonuclease H-like domain-containing protein [Eubacteriales bacterium]|nr:ribonuclease H-like domain-containing protein [Eubacteriales bacterium]
MIAPPERIIFFDIETTGFRAGRSQLYLIGTVSYEDGAWYLRQLFAEGPMDEMALINGFDEFLKEKKKGNDRIILISYNGDGFDIPYLREVERQYGLFDIFRNAISLDMFKVVKPFKKLMGTSDLKLKSIEKFCGIDREDRYSGGELIYVYEEYLRMGHIVKGGCEDNELNAALRDKLLTCLLLHNAEDIANMPLIMGIYGYKALMDGDFDFESAEVMGNVLNLRFRLRCPLPREIYIENEDIVISASGEDKTLLEAAVTLRSAELRFYYQDYKNYYYLPLEDYAIHKSLGEFVAKNQRKQATRQTCYTKKEGVFFKEAEPVFQPVFYETFKGSKYAELNDEVLENHEGLKQLILTFLV